MPLTAALKRVGLGDGPFEYVAAVGPAADAEFFWIGDPLATLRSSTPVITSL